MKEQSLKVVRAMYSFGIRYGLWMIPVVAAFVYYVDRLDEKKPWETRWKERVAEGLPPGLNDYIDSGFWCAALLGVVISVLLMVTVTIWSKKTEQTGERFESGFSKRDKKFYIVALILLLGCSLLLRLPRMEHSFWGDEEWAARRYIIGHHELDEDKNRLTFKRTHWKETLYSNKQANNHILQSALSRISLLSWQEMHDASRWEFEEWVLRVPPLVAGLGTIALVALFFHLLHLPVAGMLAAALLAVHPWHIRYSTEARGYSLAQFALVALLICVIQLSRNPRWLWACLGALASGVAVLAWPGSLIFLLVIHLGIFAILLFGNRPEGRFGIPPALRRWLAVNLFITPWLAFILFPNIPQIHRQVQTSKMFENSLDLSWFQDVGALMLSGAWWHNSEKGNPAVIDISKYYPDSMLFWWGMATVLFLILAFAVYGFLKQGSWRVVVLLAACLVGGCAMILEAIVRKHYIYHWYLTALLPIVVICVVAGIVMGGAYIVCRFTERDGVVSAVTYLIVLACVGGYAYAHKPIMQLQFDYPIEDLRGVAMLTRSNNSWPDKSKIETVLFWRGAELYDPYAHVKINEMIKLVELSEKCIKKKCPLYITVGMMPSFAEEFPLAAQTLRNPEIFETKFTLYGTEARYTLNVFRLKESPNLSQLRRIRGMIINPDQY